MYGMHMRPPASRGWISRWALVVLGAAALTLAQVGQVSAAGLVATPNSEWAGYLAAPNGGIVSVSATFKLPTVNCGDGNANSEFWGFQADGGGLTSGAFGSCDGSGGASYVVRLQSGGASVTQPGVNPGDTLVSDVFYNGVTSIAEAEIRDLTNGAYWHSEAAETGATFASVFIGGFNLGTTPPFTTAGFTKCQINGGYLAFESPTQLNQVWGSVTLVTSSRLASAGDSFKLTFKHE
jgi:hypothetical protein